MANLEDLNYTSITDMSTDEAIELLRQIRLSRRVPKKPKPKRKSKKQSMPKISKKDAAKILEILGGNK